MDEYLTTKEASVMLGVGTTSIKRWADENLIACRKTAGGHRRFSRLSLEQFRKNAKEISGAIPTDLPDMSSLELDECELGIIQLSDSGVILQYSRWEAQLSGLSAEEVIGKNFFFEVAVCTNNDLVYGAFKRGVSADSMDVTIRYTFTYRMRPTNVVLRLYRHKDSQTNWLLVDSP